MVLTIANVLALLVFIALTLSIIQKRVLFWVVAIFLTTLVLAQFTSLYISGGFIDYKFMAHFNYRDIMSMGDLYFRQVAAISILCLVIPVIVVIWKNRIRQIVWMSRPLLGYGTMFGCVVVMSLDAGMISNAFRLIRISTAGDIGFAAALDALKLRGYVHSGQIEATAGKNIIIISIESLEKGYLHPSNRALTPNLQKLAESWRFYTMTQTPGSDWTSASLYTVFTGLPCFFPGDGNTQFQKSTDCSIASVGHVLESAGYHTSFFIEDSDFAGTKDLLKVLKIDQITDKNTIAANYGTEFVSARDKDLFEAAKKEIIARKDHTQPFALMISTVDTHNPDGIFDERMQNVISPKRTQLEFMVAAVDYMVNDFIEFLEKEGLLKNTVVYIFPDHLKMGDRSFFYATGPGKLFLLTNAETTEIGYPTENEIFQIDIPSLILNGAKVKHNAKFLADYLSANKVEFLQRNEIEIARLNKAGLKRDLIWDSDLTIWTNRAGGAFVKFGKNTLSIPEDTLQKFVTQIVFSPEMRFVSQNYVHLSSDSVSSYRSTGNFTCVNVYSKNDTLYSFLQKDSRTPIFRFGVQNGITFSLNDVAFASSLPRISSVKISSNLVLFEDSETIEINTDGNREYSEFSTQLPFNLREGYLEIEYQTIGDVKPHIILFGQPYSPLSTVLHDLIPLAPKKRFLRVRIPRALTDPMLIFRAWSKTGKLIIYRYSLFGLGEERNLFGHTTESYESYVKDRNRFIAHAGGEIDGITYTNSLDALDHNYRKGFRLFELDIIKTSDGKFVAAHDWDYWARLTGYKGSLPVSEREFLQHRLLGKYTPLNMDAINQWFISHPDAILVTDKLNEPLSFAKAFVDKTRLMMELFTLEAVKEATGYGIRSAMPSQNVLESLEGDKLATLSKLGVKHVAFSRMFIAGNLSFVQRLKKNGIDAYVFHVNLENGKDEEYVVRHELDYVYGIYADKWSFE